MTVVVEVLVDELTAVIAVEAEEGQGQPVPHAMHAAEHALAALAPDTLELDLGAFELARRMSCLQKVQLRLRYGTICPRISPPGLAALCTLT